MLRELVAEAFAEIDGVVLTGSADSEDAAYQQLAAQPCEILVLDIELRQGNGIELLRRLTQLPSLENMVRIVFSNNAMGPYRRAAASLGIQFFFDKTTEFEQLRELLESLGRGEPIAAPNA